jgi:uncharacterized protein YjdB
VRFFLAKKNFICWFKNYNFAAKIINNSTYMFRIVIIILLSAVVTSCNTAITGVSLDMDAALLAVGESLTMVATVHPEDATDKTVIWSSSNNAVASVSNGKITAIADGKAIITVAARKGGKKATCTVTVAKIMTMTTDISGDMMISLAGSGTTTIDWGDDTHETFILSDSLIDYSHHYSDNDTSTVTITGIVTFFFFF